MDDVTRATLDKIEAEDTRQNHRLDVLEEEVKTIHDIATSIKELTLEIKHMNETITTQSARLDKIESAPRDRIESAKTTAISTVVSTLVGMVLGMVITLIRAGS